MHQQTKGSCRNIHPNAYKGREDEMEQRLVAVFRETRLRAMPLAIAGLNVTQRKSSKSSIQIDAVRFDQVKWITPGFASQMDGSKGSLLASISQNRRQLNKLRKHQRTSDPVSKSGYSLTAVRRSSAPILLLV